MIATIGKEWRRFLRSPALPWVLFAYVILPVLISLGYLRLLTAGQGLNPQLIPMLGGHAMSVVATWQILLLAVLAPWLSAGLLSAEVEEGTLGPLLVSGQRLIGIVVAKYLAVVLFLGLVLLVGLPLYALPFLIGGVNWTLLARVLMLEGATVVAMAALGLVLSASSRRSAGAATAGIALALLLTVGSALVAQVVPSASNPYEKGGMMIMPIMDPMGMQSQQQTALKAWLYPNPVVGLNTAVSQSAMPGLFGIAGANMKPVYKEYPLWKVQIAAAGALGIVGVLLAWGGMSARLRWRWPVWRMKRQAKEVPVRG